MAHTNCEAAVSYLHSVSGSVRKRTVEGILLIGLVLISEIVAAIYLNAEGLRLLVWCVVMLVSVIISVWVLLTDIKAAEQTLMYQKRFKKLVQCMSEEEKRMLAEDFSNAEEIPGFRFRLGEKYLYARQSNLLISYQEVTGFRETLESSDHESYVDYWLVIHLLAEDAPPIEVFRSAEFSRRKRAVDHSMLDLLREHPKLKQAAFIKEWR